VRDVKQIDKQFIGAAPGIEEMVRVQLPLLGK
jgi:hypothetical protein